MAFQAAIDLAVQTIEFDVRLTRDEQLVVLHDDADYDLAERHLPDVTVRRVAAVDR